MTKRTKQQDNNDLHSLLLLKPINYPVYSTEEYHNFTLSELEKQVHPLMASRCYTARLIGQQKSLVLQGGGNCSVKITSCNVFEEESCYLGIKGSGFNLDTIVPKGFPLVHLPNLLKLSCLNTLDDESMVNAFRCNLLCSTDPTPSVETLLHALLPSTSVDHFFL